MLFIYLCLGWVGLGSESPLARPPGPGRAGGGGAGGVAGAAAAAVVAVAAAAAVDGGWSRCESVGSHSPAPWA